MRLVSNMTSNSERYYHRDLSWLRFNHRVLQEAADDRNPLYERIKFLAIFSSNLDEFFKVRVSEIRQIKGLKKKLRKKLITKPNKLLRRIKEEVYAQQQEFGRIYQSEIIPALKQMDIYLTGYHDFNEHQQEYAERFFKEIESSIHLMTSQADGNEIVFLANEEIYLVGKLPHGDLMWIKVNSQIPRFVTFPGEDEGITIAFIDDILKYNLLKIYEVPFHAIKASRDAELYIEDEFSGDLLEKIKRSLPNRDKGQITRLLYDEQMPNQVLEEVTTSLDVNETDLVPGGSYHNLKDLFDFPQPIDKSQIFFEELIPITPSWSTNCKTLFRTIFKKDRILYFPYESFAPIVRLIEEAAADPMVTKIKITLYRVSKHSAVASALVDAVKNGKEVSVFIETKARFDEENNIIWGKKLEDNGAKVIYSYPGIKIHSKILYIERSEGDSSRGYGYIATGNFNENTAKIYTDFGILSANPVIVNELAQVFAVIERSIIIPKTKKLLVSPFNGRTTFRSLVKSEIDNVRNGYEGTIILKLNSLQDPEMIDLLYEASTAGVQIRMLIRGICCLVPGIANQSENIYITSIVDRFLEHSRVYIFHNRGKEKMYLGSADWMTRNLDHRIEVVTPITNPDVFTKVRQALDLQLNDRIKARIIDQNQTNSYVSEKTKGASAQHLSHHLVASYQNE